MIDASLWMLGNPEVSTVSASTFAKIGPKARAIGRAAGFKAVEASTTKSRILRPRSFGPQPGPRSNSKSPGRRSSKETDEFGIELMGSKGGARVYVKDYAKVGEVRLLSI